MKFPDWLEAEKGRSAALAAHFGKSAGAISQWKRDGVPLRLMKAVRDFTGGAVGLEEMVPDPGAESVVPVDTRIRDLGPAARAKPQPPADHPRRRAYEQPQPAQAAGGEG